jgi:hypothetical protein
MWDNVGLKRTYGEPASGRYRGMKKNANEPRSSNTAQPPAKSWAVLEQEVIGWLMSAGARLQMIDGGKRIWLVKWIISRALEGWKPIIAIEVFYQRGGGGTAVVSAEIDGLVEEYKNEYRRVGEIREETALPRLIAYLRKHVWAGEHFETLAGLEDGQPDAGVSGHA